MDELEELREGGHAAMSQELLESRVLVERLRRELADSEESRKEMESTTLEQWNRIVALQTELEEATQQISDLNQQVSVWTLFRLIT